MSTTEEVPGMIHLKEEDTETKTHGQDILSDFKIRLDKLVMAKEAGLITQEEFEKNYNTFKKESELLYNQ